MSSYNSKRGKEEDENKKYTTKELLQCLKNIRNDKRLPSSLRRSQSMMVKNINTEIYVQRLRLWCCKIEWTMKEHEL